MTKEEKQRRFQVEKSFKIGKKILMRDKQKEKEEWKEVEPEVKYIIWDWKKFDYKLA